MEISAEDKRFYICGILSISHMVGEAMQYFHFGAEIFKGHLSNFGFPFITAYLLHFIFRTKIQTGLIIGEIIGIVYEILQLITKDGDPYDLLMYFIAGIIGLLIIKYIK